CFATCSLLPVLPDRESNALSRREAVRSRARRHQRDHGSTMSPPTIFCLPVEGFRGAPELAGALGLLDFWCEREAEWEGFSRVAGSLFEESAEGAETDAAVDDAGGDVADVAALAAGPTVAESVAAAGPLTEGAATDDGRERVENTTIAIDTATNPNT